MKVSHSPRPCSSLRFCAFPLLMAIAILSFGPGLSAQTVSSPEVNTIFQFFAPAQVANARPGSGAYLWIPPATPQIRAVMIGIHNGLPLTILQNPEIRAICRKHGIAQILFTPNGSEIGPVMLKELNFDVTDPEKTAVYDRYLAALAGISQHPELVKAPIVPLAHSAYMDFPFDAAMRNPEQCLAAIPIKAGTPDKYTFYAPGGKSKVPRPELCLRNVPLLILDSAAQETVVSRWKSSPYPQKFEPNFMGAYRRDRNDNPGTEYEPRNELIGGCWDMLSGHFDLFPRNYRFIASWLDAVAQGRLPSTPSAPLKALTLKDGWLMDPKAAANAKADPEAPAPALYLLYKGNRAKALWFPNEQLARGLYELQQESTRLQVEVFTVLDPSGKPVSLAETPMAVMPNAFALLKEDGQFTLSTWHFTTPPQICTLQEKGHDNRPDVPHQLANVLFPKLTALPPSGIPVQLDPNGGPVEVLRAEPFSDTRGTVETRFTLRLKLNRLAPDPSYQHFYPRLFHDGNSQFVPAGRTVKMEWNLNDGKNRTDQTLTFPPVPDAKASTRFIPLKATSSAKLPVGYFVQKGPGFIQNGMFIPAEVPVGVTRPIEVTIGAYQCGIYQESGGVKPARTLYQTFRLIP